MSINFPRHFGFERIGDQIENVYAAEIWFEFEFNYAVLGTRSGGKRLKSTGAFFLTDQPNQPNLHKKWVIYKWNYLKNP